jgi:tetratricopeptide (TPR) repeat protein
LNNYIAVSLVLVITCIAGSQTQNTSPQILSRTNLDEFITQVQDDTYDCKFDEALVLADKIIRAFPGDPEGYLYKCGVRWKMLEEGCVSSKDSAKDEIKVLIDKACVLSGQKLQSDPNNVRSLFYYASSLLYRAGFGAVNHDWFAVMSDGGKAKQLLEKAISMDSSFYDAYSGLGAFNYYAARIPWYVKPVALLLGVNGNEEKGVAELKKAVRFGNYSKAEAAVFLASVVYVNDEDYANAAALMSQLHQQYPDNLDFVQNLCHDHFELHNYQEVIRLANTALEGTDPDGSCHQKSLSFIRFYRGESYEKMNEKVKAISDFQIVVRVRGENYPGRQAKVALDKLRNQ